MPLITIEKLREMSSREFAKTFKKLTVAQMKDIILTYGVWVKSSCKSIEIQELLLDTIDGIVSSSEDDINKIEKSKARKLKVKVPRVVSEVHNFLAKYYEVFNSPMVQKNVQGVEAGVEIGLIVCPELETLEEIKSFSRKIYLEIHPDKAKKGVKKYTQVFGCYKALFDTLFRLKKEAIDRESSNDFF